ncbi:MAG: FmdB family zinc ribbon protein [Spirochaetota bacterium]
MPIFEYACDRCGETFETLVRSPQQQVSCPGCSSSDIHKLVSMFARSSRSVSGSEYGEAYSSGSGCSGCSGGNCSQCG